MYQCPLPRPSNGQLRFATCFICHKEGHLSRDCPENEHGLYPNGGCCHICKRQDHLAKDCPQKEKEVAKTEDEDVVKKSTTSGSKRSAKERVVGGDDELLDDFDVPLHADEERKPKKEKESFATKHKKRKLQ